MNAAQSKAVRIACQVMRDLKLVPGTKETDAARWIKSQFKKYGATSAFKIIVGSGSRSALPHCFATDKIMKKGELVIVDFGATVQGFRSDITRTFILGQPTAKQKKIYRILAEAQQAALRAVKAGVSCKSVDLAARGYIEKQGYGKYFIHTTGHGIRTRVHQGPKISRRNNHLLKVGQVVTIEPGIYIKGFGGVRIEDMIEVTKKGYKLLTKV